MELVTVRCLTPGAKAVREAVFITEQGFQNEFDEIDARAVHVVLYDGGTAAATGRAFPKENGSGTWLLGRIAVRKEYRGQKLGLMVVNALEAEAKKAGADTAELSAQLQAKGFYEKAGYTAQGGVYKDEHCPHVKMTKPL